MGFCLLIAHGAYLLYVKHSSDLIQKRGITLLVAVTVLMLSVRTVLRNDVWNNEENLYKSGITINPAKGKYYTDIYSFI
jgi:hypothetical protein